MTEQNRNKLIRALEESHGVSRIRYPAGIVVVYSGHWPPGLFLVLNGAVGWYDSDTANPAARRSGSSSADAPFMVPSLRSVNAPMPATVIAEEPLEMLSVPRSLVLTNEYIRRLLTDAAKAFACSEPSPAY